MAREADARAAEAETVGKAATVPPPPLASAAQPTVTEDDGEPDGPEPSSIPHILLSEEDLSFFSLKAASRAVLDAIDGVSTVDAIARRLTIPRNATLALLRELGTRGIVDFF